MCFTKTFGRHTLDFTLRYDVRRYDFISVAMSALNIKWLYDYFENIDPDRRAV